MLFNRLWPLIVLGLVSAAVGFFVPQVPAIATGYCLLVALLWRHQSRAVEAIEGRDGVEFWLDRSSPLGRPAAAAPARPAQDRAGVMAAGGSRPRTPAKIGFASQRERLRSLSSSAQGRVFATWSGVSQARRAVATPKRMFASVRGQWASESITSVTPASPAALA